MLKLLFTPDPKPRAFSKKTIPRDCCTGVTVQHKPFATGWGKNQARRNKNRVRKAKINRLKQRDSNIK